jgi:hypothetical protein
MKTEHEIALDKALAAAEFFESSFSEVAFLKNHPDLKAEVDLLAVRLFDLYQRIGAAE